MSSYSARMYQSAIASEVPIQKKKGRNTKSQMGYNYVRGYFERYD